MPTARVIEAVDVLEDGRLNLSADKPAAVASGLNVARIKILAFAISALFAALAGMLFAVKLSGGSPMLANGFLLPAIVAVLVGGTPLTGAVGGGDQYADRHADRGCDPHFDALFRGRCNAATDDGFWPDPDRAIALTIDRSKRRIVK